MALDAAEDKANQFRGRRASVIAGPDRQVLSGTAGMYEPRLKRLEIIWDEAEYGATCWPIEDVRFE
jgi:hypothetical protein